MSILHTTPLQPRKQYLFENLFSLTIAHELNATKLTMVVFGEILSTRKLPLTSSILKKKLPQIFLSKCFNDDKLPFAIEVKRTEIGHLFEHILLEYLCQQKFLKGFKFAEFSGETNWNWLKEPMGVFHIEVSAGLPEADLFPEAIYQSAALIERIMGKSSSAHADPVSGVDRLTTVMPGLEERF